MTYTIKLPVFEGPFDLLLHLIKVNEMDISDIRISEITQQYLDYIRVMRELDLELAGEFLVMAATLIHLKARTLVPPVKEAEDTEEEVEEVATAQDLVRQLIEYRKYKEAAAALRQREDEVSRWFYRSNIVTIEPETTEELSLDVTLLYKALARVLSVIEAPAFAPELTEQFTVEEKIRHIEDLVAREQTVDLFDVFRRCFNKSEIIVTFLAVLELTRLKQITVSQDNAFDAITIRASNGQLEYDTPQ
ncbi:MAG: segregation/condensation protein A [Candidatus Sumerlaeaceae bacterium]|nr:segregation/condensation protein A [Candidatus Sumerlaeaceae bacterium]